MILYQSKYLTIEGRDADSLLIINWNSSSSELSNEMCKSEMLKQVDFCIQKKPENLLINSLKFDYSIVPVLQEYIDKNIVSKYIEYGVKKIAFIVSENIFASVSIEQTMSERSDRLIDTRYFENEVDAQDWLNQK